MIKVLLSGCNGRMGCAISEMCLKSMDTIISAGVDINKNCKFTYPVYTDFASVRESSDVVIDFSNPSVLPELIDYCVGNKIPLVSCTTGYTEENLKLIDKASESIPVFRSGNMSLGVNLLIMLVRQASKILGDSFDIEIVEKHHNQKLDAPSGTAVMLAEAIEESVSFAAERVYDRHSYRAKRAYNEIGIHSVRGGTIVGEHDVIFAGNNETLELKHIAQSREVFAAGALRAARYLNGCKKAGKYSMDDLLGDICPRE